MVDNQSGIGLALCFLDAILWGPEFFAVGLGDGQSLANDSKIMTAEPPNNPGLLDWFPFWRYF